MTEEMIASSDNVEQTPVAVQSQPTPTAVPTEFNIPDGYKEKAWAKNIKSSDDLWKAHDNAQALIGKKTIGLPDWNNEEQVKEYFSKITPEKYELTGIEESQRDNYSNLFKEVGLSQLQANKIVDAYVKMNQPLIEKEYGAKSLEESLKAEFKDETYLKGLTKEVIDIFGKEMFDSNDLNNKAIVQLFKGFSKIKEQYGIKELNANVSAEHGTAGLSSEDLNGQIRTSLARIQALDGKFNSGEEKAREIKRYNELLTMKSNRGR